MKTSRYNELRRNKFVITTLSSAELDLPTNNTSLQNPHYISNLLNQKYRLENFDYAPYHYIVGKDEYIEIKNPYLKHEEVNHLSPYNNDIKILLLCSSIEHATEAHARFCAEIIAFNSLEFVMPIYGNIILPETNNLWLIGDIEKESISLRNKNNPHISIYESIQGEDIFVNNNVIIKRADLVDNSLIGASLRYHLPLDLIQELNPHLIEGRIKDNDIVFLPNKLSISVLDTLSGIEKTSQFQKNYSDLMVSFIDESEDDN